MDENDVTTKDRPKRRSRLDELAARLDAQEQRIAEAKALVGELPHSVNQTDLCQAIRRIERALEAL